MTFRSRFATVLGAVGLAAAVAYAPAASADRVGFSLSVGGPGYAVSVGNYGGYYDRYYVAPPPPVYYAPAPVYRPYYPPAPVYRPYYAPVVVAPPVVVRPYPVYRPYYRDRYWDRRDVRHDRHDRRHDRQEWRR
jgi:hypothetical protein